MELGSAARRYLLGQDVVQGLVGQSDLGPWVFKDVLGEVVDQTGRLAFVVSQQPGWASPDPVQDAEFPRLFIDCIADNSRTPDGDAPLADASDRARGGIRAVRPLFSFPNLRSEWMGGVGSNPGLFVVSSQIWADARRITPADSHPPQAGDTVTIRLEVALKVVH